MSDTGAAQEKRESDLREAHEAANASVQPPHLRSPIFPKDPAPFTIILLLLCVRGNGRVARVLHGWEPQYRFTVRPLTEDEGGGYLIEFPDLPGCMSDGETIADGIANGEDAKRCWIAAMKEAGRSHSPRSLNGSCAPKSLHRRLAEQAKREGVSLNTLAVTLLAEGLGERDAHER